MRKIVYYVASSIDGFISGLNDDISGFIGKGNGVEKYLADLANYDTVIMGRNTYEFGYKYGLQPGQPAYPHMKHYIFTNNLKMHEGADIYLCGGGQFAGWLLDNKKIDTLKLKLNPLILGQGKKLFGNSNSKYKLELLETSDYENGLQIMTYNICY
jgi:dihydrofolate reductase